MDTIEKILLTPKSETHNEKNIEFLNAIQDSIAIGSWEVDLRTMTIEWSEMTKRIHEVPSDYVPTFDKAFSFYPEEKYREIVSNAFERAVKFQEKYDIELKFISAKNNTKWVRSIGFPVYENNECVKVRGIFQDITEKTNRVDDIILKEKQINTTWHHSPNGMAIIGLDSKLKSVNNRLCEFLEYSEEELIDLNFERLTHPEDKNIDAELIIEMIDGARDHYEIEKRYISKSGETVSCLVSVSILRDKHNLPVHYIANLANVSKLREAKNDIKDLLHTTESQNLRLLNFAHIVSHNLRSHSGNLEMLLDLVEDEIPEATDNEYYPLINDAVNNLSETILNLNEISSINTRSYNDLTHLNLLDYTEKAVSSTKAKAIETDATITLDIDKDVEVLSLPAYLDSILLNFLTNAIKYRQPNISPNIRFKAQKTNHYIKLDIEDNGLGIDLNLHKNKLFGLYKTFHKHEDSRGLGLFITKNHIDAIGGKVEVKSEVNKGTVFSLYFRYE